MSKVRKRSAHVSLKVKLPLDLAQSWPIVWLGLNLEVVASGLLAGEIPQAEDRRKSAAAVLAVIAGALSAKAGAMKSTRRAAEYADLICVVAKLPDKQAICTAIERCCLPTAHYERVRVELKRIRDDRNAN